MTDIRPCDCKEGPATKFQDEVYGKGMRVHNSRSAESEGNWRCTICGRVKD